jgi:hypothetical protein
MGSSGDFSVWGSELGEFFLLGIGMEEKVPPEEVWGWGRYFTPLPVETPSLKTLLK